MLVKFVKEKKDSWEQFLDTCVFAYNTTQQESNHYSPFELMFGRRALLPTDLSLLLKNLDFELKIVVYQTAILLIFLPYQSTAPWVSATALCSRSPPIVAF